MHASECHSLSSHSNDHQKYIELEQAKKTDEAGTGTPMLKPLEAHV